jgi:hypothetical protein
MGVVPALADLPAADGLRGTLQTARIVTRFARRIPRQFPLFPLFAHAPRFRLACAFLDAASAAADGGRVEEPKGRSV